MALASDDKKKIIEKFSQGKGDTGSPEVQVALLSERINKLAAHLKKHAHDVHSRRGLLKMVSMRRKFLDFLSRTNEKKYSSVIKKLGLKK